MSTLEARLETPNASRYLQQVCKHWAHKFAVEFTPERGTIPFGPDRSCVLKADTDALTLRVAAPDAEGAARLAGVVAEHVQRFAFREALPAPHWREAGGPTDSA